MDRERADLLRHIALWVIECFAGWLPRSQRAARSGRGSAPHKKVGQCSVVVPLWIDDSGAVGRQAGVCVGGEAWGALLLVANLATQSLVKCAFEFRLRMQWLVSLLAALREQRAFAWHNRTLIYN